MTQFLFAPFSKVVTAREMARVEKLAVAHGHSEEKFMEEAGRKVAQGAMELAKGKRIGLLVGKGNNGGDAYAAGVCLLEEGFEVRAWALYEEKECSELNQKMRHRFLEKRGKLSSDLSEMGLLVDGLLGTGFRGKLESKLAEAIHWANGSGKAILAIDIPSGLDGTTGEGGGIVAQVTVALGLAKSGFFLREGWNRVGRLRVENFGLPVAFAEEAEAFAYLPDLQNIAQLLPPIVRTRHKYQAGYVVGFAGSEEFKGAPKMAGLAALRAGAGIVRIFSREEIGDVPYELICQKWTQKEWSQELKRAKAVFIGPGLGQSVTWLKRELKKLQVPCVLDADALQKGISFPEEAILTPHRGEMLRLLGVKKGVLEEEFLALCEKFVRKNKIILVLKGAPTFVFMAQHPPVIVPRGDPGMATAGSGDVLTGVIAALLAQGMKPFSAAVLGVMLHAIAGEEAAKEKTSYGEIAGDLVEFLPQAFQAVMKWAVVE